MSGCSAGKAKSQPFGTGPLSFLLLLVVALLSSPFAAGSALTTTIEANQRTCFYALVDEAGEKVR